MIFNLTSQEVFKIKSQNYAIKCKDNYGPYFGVSELDAAFEPLNGNNKCNSNANKFVYKIGIEKESTNLLTKLKC
jgi:hypothetical protein